jgi:hypothetical protein
MALLHSTLSFQVMRIARIKPRRDFAAAYRASAIDRITSDCGTRLIDLKTPPAAD